MITSLFLANYPTMKLVSLWYSTQDGGMVFPCLSYPAETQSAPHRKTKYQTIEKFAYFVSTLPLLGRSHLLAVL